MASSIRLAVPLLLASLGESYGQRSGVLNLGVDGIMLLGAFGGYYTVLRTGNVWLGLLVGIGTGLVLGLISAVMAVTLQAEQGISGIGVFLFGLGMSDLPRKAAGTAEISSTRATRRAANASSVSPVPPVESTSTPGASSGWVATSPMQHCRPCRTAPNEHGNSSTWPQLYR